jgi:hypothetical protein
MAFSMAAGRAFRTMVATPTLRATLSQPSAIFAMKGQLKPLLAPRWVHGMPAVSAPQSSPVAMEEGLITAIANDIKRAKPLFAVVHVGGKQYRVTADDVIVTNLLPLNVGESIKLEKVGHTLPAIIRPR